MTCSLDNILTTVESRVKETENGYIKLGFESGKLVAAALYNNPTEEEKKYPVVENDFSLRNELKNALKGTFFGTLGFVFAEKKITNCYKSQSWKGSTLEHFVRG